MKTKESILKEHDTGALTTDVVDRQDAISAMEEWSKEEMIALLNNIRHQPIQCYSEKVRGQDPKYFLGRSYVDDLINRIKK